jgi:hypothetical protein
MNKSILLISLNPRAIAVRDLELLARDLEVLEFMQNDS